MAEHDIRKEGTVTVTLTIPPGYWDSSGEPCHFPPLGVKGVAIYTEIGILGDHRFAVSIDGPLGRFWELESRPITDRPPRAMIAVTWNGEEINFYVNGVLHQTARREPLP